VALDSIAIVFLLSLLDYSDLRSFQIIARSSTPQPVKRGEIHSHGCLVLVNKEQVTLPGARNTPKVFSWTFAKSARPREWQRRGSAAHSRRGLKMSRIAAGQKGGHKQNVGCGFDLSLIAAPGSGVVCWLHPNLTSQK
jgi:hypothetical protein